MASTMILPFHKFLTSLFSYLRSRKDLNGHTLVLLFSEKQLLKSNSCGILGDFLRASGWVSLSIPARFRLILGWLGVESTLNWSSYLFIWFVLIALTVLTDCWDLDEAEATLHIECALRVLTLVWVVTRLLATLEAESGSPTVSLTLGR